MVVYASVGSGAEPQVIRVASSTTRAEELAERQVEDRCAWQRPDWLEWDSARRVRRAVDGHSNAVQVWLVQVGLDELIRCVAESEPPVEEHDRRRPLPSAAGPVFMTVGTGCGWRVKAGR
jgi:hypothetical protein